MKPSGLLVLTLLGATLGCGAARRSGDATTSSTRPSSSVITRSEIVASGLMTMQEVIERLRPHFLRSRGRSSIMRTSSDQVEVYLDDVYGGNTSVLRNIDATTVQQVEFVSGPETGFRFGRNHSAGVIHIVTRRGDPGGSDASGG
jgi:outer membrane cobalamin receptor